MEKTTPEAGLRMRRPHANLAGFVDHYWMGLNNRDSSVDIRAVSHLSKTPRVQRRTLAAVIECQETRSESTFRCRHAHGAVHENLAFQPACRIILLNCMPVAANQNPVKEPAVNQPMQLQSSYPVVVTGKLKESREFYTRWFGFETVFEASWFIYLQAGGGQPWGLAFMSPDHPSKPPGPEAFSGKGMFLTFQVVDASAEFARLKAAGVRIAYPLKDEPWGQRRFGVFDPAGMWLDVVEQIEPAPGFWEPYMKP